MKLTFALAFQLLCIITPAQASGEDNQPMDMGQYLKSRTQFDGITVEEFVTYLTLDSSSSVTLPLLTTAKLDTPLDFTVMLWIKFSEETLANPTGMQFIYGLPGSVSCFLTKTLSIMCDTETRTKLEVTSDQLVAEKWIHLVLSSKSDGIAYLMIHDSIKVLDIDSKQIGFDVTQTVNSGWSLCLGSCLGEVGFSGGLREFVARSSYITSDLAFQSSHEVFTYANDFKSYFRFSNVDDQFNKDEFVDRTWIAYTNRNGVVASNDPKSTLTVASLVGQDIIPNDICPITTNYVEFVKFNDKSRLRTFNFGQQLKQTSYEYTMSLTIFISDTTCTNPNPTDAIQQGCYIVYLDSVFMLYFEQNNMARFRFLSNKNYYETSSKNFFVPYDQWITIQLTMSQYDGWKFVVLDLNGKAIVKQSLKLNLQTQRPRGSLSLFNSLVGSVSDFRICTSSSAIPIDSNQLSNCFIQLSLTSDDVSGIKVNNQGNGGGQFQFDRSPSFGQVLYDVSTYGMNTTNGLITDQSNFDSIACNDSQVTVQLDDESSSFRFDTPPQSDWLSETTIEFWLKPMNPTDDWFKGQKSILQMQDPETSQIYFQIYIKGGDLVCAPFGTALITNPQVVIRDFSNSNTDQWGWWHISCGYAYQQNLQMTLKNDRIDNFSSTSLIGFGDFIPQNSLSVSFGAPFDESSGVSIGTIAIKEVRHWGKSLTQDEISQSRRRQIDPTVLPPGQLLSYYRLGSGTLIPYNFAQTQSEYDFTQSNAEIDGGSLFQDAIIDTQYVIDEATQKYGPIEITTFHTICPLYTYLLDTYCYSEPINQLIIAVLPDFDEKSGTLSWVFSTLYSSAIDQDILPQLFSDWTADDNVLQNQFNVTSETGERIVNAKSLRQESTYHVNVQLYNAKPTFTALADLIFVPSQCHWFEVAGSDAINGSQLVTSSTGLTDLNFQLVLKKHPTFDCGNFNFYDQFVRLDFQFILTNSVQFFELIPKVQTDVKQNGDDITIDITVPKSEQYKFPVNQEIKIIMTVRWTSTEYADEVAVDDLVFQNVIYTLQYEPGESSLVARFVQNKDKLFIGDQLVMDASLSYISNLPKNLSQKDMVVEWICPPQIASLCTDPNAYTLVIDFDKFANMPISNKVGSQFGVNFQISAKISWLDGSADPPSAMLTGNAKWVNSNETDNSDPLNTANQPLTQTATSKQTVAPPTTSTSTVTSYSPPDSNTTPVEAVTQPSTIGIPSKTSNNTATTTQQPTSSTNQPATVLPSSPTPPKSTPATTSVPQNITVPLVSTPTKTTPVTSPPTTPVLAPATSQPTTNVSSNTTLPSTPTTTNTSPTTNQPTTTVPPDTKTKFPLTSQENSTAVPPATIVPSTPTTTPSSTPTAPIKSTPTTTPVSAPTTTPVSTPTTTPVSTPTTPIKSTPTTTPVPTPTTTPVSTPTTTPVSTPTTPTKSTPTNTPVSAPATSSVTPAGPVSTTTTSPSTPANQTSSPSGSLTPTQVIQSAQKNNTLDIQVYPNPVMVTDGQAYLFTIVNLQVSEQNIQNYYIAWSITPNIINPTGRKQFGANLQVDPGNWAENTQYVVQVSISPKTLGSLTIKKSISFTTGAPPKNGAVSIVPSDFRAGNPITVSVSDWVTQKGPIVWNVFASVDAKGALQGEQLNKTPLTQSDAFSFIVSNNPFFIVISDTSGEETTVIKGLQSGGINLSRSTRFTRG